MKKLLIITGAAIVLFGCNNPEEGRPAPVDSVTLRPGEWTIDDYKRKFDSAISIGREAMDIANEVIQERDSVIRLLTAWRYAALKCNPKIIISGRPSPSPIPDTVKPKIKNGMLKRLEYDSMTVFSFSYFAHSGDIQPLFHDLLFKPKFCYHYQSEFGYKECNSTWVIKDTMKLINALLYDLWSSSRAANNKP